MGNSRNLILKWERNQSNCKSYKRSNTDLLRRKRWPSLRGSFMDNKRAVVLTPTDAAGVHWETWSRKTFEKTIKGDDYGMDLVRLFARKFLVNSFSHLMIHCGSLWYMHVILLWHHFVSDAERLCGLTSFYNLLK